MELTGFVSETAARSRSAASLTRGHRGWIVKAPRIEHVDPPSDPYLSLAR